MYKLDMDIVYDLGLFLITQSTFQTLLYTHIRLAHLFSKYESRIQCVQARLQSIAILGKACFRNKCEEGQEAVSCILLL